MTFTITYSLENEITGLHMQLEQVSQGWFLPHGWYVLPDNHEDPNLPICIIPDCNHSLLKPAKLFLPEDHQVSQLLNQINLQLFSPEFQDLWKSVYFQVHPTRFGTYGYWTYESDTRQIHLFLREDQPLNTIIELAISSLQKKLWGEKFNWQQQEAIGDYLTNLINPHYVGTLERIFQTSPELLNKSVDYLRHLKAPLGQLIIEKDNILYYHDKILNPILSSSERLFLSCLIANYSQLVTYDQLANIIYGFNADTKFSLWGIRKTAQRVRQKLSRQGLPANLIQNLSGQGYLLN